MALRFYVSYSGILSAAIFLSACSSTATLPDSYYDDIAFESAAVSICQRQGMIDNRIAQLNHDNTAYTLGLGSYDKGRLDGLYQKYMKEYQSGLSPQYCSYIASNVVANEGNIHTHQADEKRQRAQDINMLKGMIPATPQKEITRCRSMVGVGYDVECETTR